MCVHETPGRSSGCQAFLHAQHGLEGRAGPLIVASAAEAPLSGRKACFSHERNLKARKAGWRW